MDKSGPAFPNSESQKVVYGGGKGMSLRQWYAGKALQGFCSGANPTKRELDDRASMIAEGCYKLADAMLTEGTK